MNLESCLTEFPQGLVFCGLIFSEQVFFWMNMEVKEKFFEGDVDLLAKL